MGSSVQTPTTLLHSAGLSARQSYVGPILTEWHWDHWQWPLQQWYDVLTSDESRSHLKNSDSRVQVWHFHGDCANGSVDAGCKCGISMVKSTTMTVQMDHYRGGSVMVWSGISYNHRTPKLMPSTRGTMCWDIMSCRFSRSANILSGYCCSICIMYPFGHIILSWQLLDQVI